MKKTKLWNNVLSTKARKAVASALALSMVLSGASYATTKSSGEAAKAADGASSFLSGDVNLDGEVTLDDAQLALKGALKIETNFTELQLYAADVDSNNELDLTDAQMILKAALIIEELPDKEPPASGDDNPTTGPAVSTTPVESEEPTAKPATSRKPLPTGIAQPSQTPRPSLEPVVAKPEDVVKDYEQVQIKKLNQAQVVSAEGVNGKEYAQYVFGPMEGEITQGAVSAAGISVPVEDIVQIEGMQAENPFAGRTDLRENVEDVIRTERINDKPTVWELSGAAIIPTGGAVDLKQVDVRVTNAEPQGHKFCDQENIDYTRPEWTKGMTYSFWAKADSKTKGDPIFTIENDQYIFSVRMNGSVRFVDVNSVEYRNCWESQSDQINGVYGEWNHYTITIANDWIQVYVNGQENLYTKVLMNRSVMEGFNDGFLTRYNPISVVTQADVDKDIRQYYWGIDSTGHSAWYLNEETNAYEGHDDFSIFVNKRFSGSGAGDPLLMNLLTAKSAKVWIGGADTSIEPSVTARQFKMNANVADIRAYDSELTAAQVAACYEFDTVTPEAIEWDITKVEEKEVVEVATGGAINIAEDGLGVLATYDEAKDVLTFLDIENAEEEEEQKGVEVVNPFAGATEAQQTLESALEGQPIFPWLAANGGTIETVQLTDAVGCSDYGVQVMRGNFYDVWYGDPAIPGDQMNPPTGTNLTDDSKDKIMTYEQIEAAYGNNTVKYHRPVWDKGLSVSFWAKPVEVDDSPLLTFYRSNNMLLVVSVRGDVCFYSLDGQTDWYKNSIAPNHNCYNSFSALGDPSYVKEGEWNYYTVTFTNDWIQVYVNGVEMVYTEANLNRGYNKMFNKGYLTKHNTIGIWTTEVYDREGEPSGTTLEGTERNYLKKSGYIHDLNISNEIWENPQDHTLHSSVSPYGFNGGKDSASIRANGVYKNPFNSVPNSKLLIDLLTDPKAKMYIGGISSTISLENEYMFQDLQMTMTEAESEEFRGKVHFNDVVYETKAETAEDGTITYVPTDKETVLSRCKFFFSDHLLDEGTQVSGISSELKELSAQEVKDNYAKAVMPE